MNDIIPITDPNVLTMSSKEIADLCEKEHKHVMRDIRNMLKSLEKDESNFGHIYLDSYGREHPIFNLDYELTMTLLTGYSIELRNRVIKRWRELESKPSVDPMQALSDPAIMRGLLLTYTEKVITLENKVLEQEPKVQAFNRIAGADGMINLQTAGKVLQQKPNKFIQKLREIRWLFKRPGAKYNSAYVDKINAGYLATKAHEYEKPDGTIHVNDQIMVTPKGLAKLALVFGVTLDSDENNGGTLI